MRDVALMLQVDVIRVDTGESWSVSIGGDSMNFLTEDPKTPATWLANQYNSQPNTIATINEVELP